MKSSTLNNMKLKDLINRVDKQEKFKDKIYIGSIAEELFNENISNYDDQDRLVAYFVGSWYCTDTFVGYRVYFFDNEPVAVSSQTGRKMDEVFEWVSQEAFKKVKDYIYSFKEAAEEEQAVLLNPDEEVSTYKIMFNSQLFDYHKGIPLYNGEKVKIVECEKKDKNGFGIEEMVKIQFEKDADQYKWVKVGQLDFPFNLITN